MRKFGFLNTDNRVIFWLLITSLFIIIGAGHGGGPFVFLEFYYFPFVTSEEFVTPTDIQSISLPLIALIFFFGHVALIATFFIKSLNRKTVMMTIGIFLIWLPIIMLYIYSNNNPGTVLLVGSVLPFVFVTLFAFLSRPIDSLMHRR